MRQPRQYTIEQFLNTTNIFSHAFSPNEDHILFTSNRSGIYNAYAVSITGGEPLELTHSTTDSIHSVSYFPAGSRILFLRDKGGDENYHLCVLDANGEERDLTPGDEVRAWFVCWSHDEKSFYYATNERDKRFFDLYQMRIGSFERELLYKNREGYNLNGMSKNGRYLALVKYNSAEDSDIFLYDLSAERMTHLTPHNGDIFFRATSFDVLSHYLHYLTNEGSEFSYLARCELTTGKRELVEKASWDILHNYFSPNGRYNVVSIKEDVLTNIRIYDQVTGETLSLPELPEGNITTVSISKSERLMAFYVDSERAPSDLYLYDFATQQVRRLTDSLSLEIDPADLVESKLVRHKSFDGLVISSLLWKPHQASSSNKAPALVLVHGGPEGQTTKRYYGNVQYLVNHGYVIMGVNFRGSSGYGKSFLAANNRKHGREPLWDCVEAKRYLASLDYVDASKIGIIGSSYGGYMVLAALAFTPEEFAVGVDLFGVSNWLRTLQSFPAYWDTHRKFMYRKFGDPSTDKEMLQASSPLFHADKITRPLLVLQGANDPYVVKAESDDIVEAVRKNNGIVEYIVFSDEGHGFVKKANEIRAYKAMLDFLDLHLRGHRKEAMEHPLVELSNSLR